MYLKLFHLRGLRGRKQITLLKQTFARYFRLVKVQSSNNFKSIARTSLVVELNRFDLVSSRNIFSLVLHFIGNAFVVDVTFLTMKGPKSRKLTLYFLADTCSALSLAFYLRNRTNSCYYFKICDIDFLINTYRCQLLCSVIN